MEIKEFRERVDLTKYFFGEREFLVFPQCGTATIFSQKFRENNYVADSLYHSMEKKYHKTRSLFLHVKSASFQNPKGK